VRPELIVVTLTGDPIDHRVHAAAAGQPVVLVQVGGQASRCRTSQSWAEARATGMVGHSRVVVKCVKLGLLSDEFLRGGLDGDEVR